MGIALTRAHRSEMGALATLDPAPLDPMCPDTAHFASRIGKLSSRLVVLMVMAPTRYIPMRTHRLPFSRGGGPTRVYPNADWQPTKNKVTFPPPRNGTSSPSQSRLRVHSIYRV